MIPEDQSGAPTGSAHSGCIASLPEARQALVFSGGGALGAYGVGVVKALSEGVSPASQCHPIDFEIYSGSSVGSYNAAFMVSQRPALGPRTVDELVRVWRERIANTPKTCGNGAFRIRGAPFQFLDAGCFLHPVQNAVDLAGDVAPLTASFLAQAGRFLTSDETIQAKVLQSVDVGAFISVEPLDSLVADTIDLARIAEAPERLSVVASDWEAGRPVIFDNRDPALPIDRRSILASMALPGLFPPVDIGGTPFVDGAVTMNTPLNPVIEAGADVLHVIYSDPLVDQIPFPNVPSTLDTLYRLYVILVAHRFNADLGTASAINLLLRRGRSGAAPGVAEHMSVAAVGAIEEERAASIGRAIGDSDYRLLEIHKYRPKSVPNTAGGLVDFHLHTIDHSLTQGFEDTRHHDCRAEGCLVIEIDEWEPSAHPRTTTAHRGGIAWQTD